MNNNRGQATFSKYAWVLDTIYQARSISFKDLNAKQEKLFARQFMLLQVITLQESKGDYERCQLTMTCDWAQGIVPSSLGPGRPPHTLHPKALPPASTRC